MLEFGNRNRTSLKLNAKSVNANSINAVGLNEELGSRHTCKFCIYACHSMSNENNYCYHSPYLTHEEVITSA